MDDIPQTVRQLAQGREIRQVWHNELGGITYALGDDLHVKWSPHSTGFPLDAEVARLEWAAAHIPVPPVLDHGTEGEADWMLTATLRGGNAVSAHHKAAPERTVSALGRALRRLHDALPTLGCSFDWSSQSRLSRADTANAREILASTGGGWRDAFPESEIEQALRMLGDPPGIDQLVVCRGDSCAPNTLLTDDCELVGYVDLGRLGLADRWADIAVATWSTVWNYGPGWEQTFLDAYGIEPDPERTLFYRALWDITP